MPSFPGEGAVVARGGCRRSQGRMPSFPGEGAVVPKRTRLSKSRRQCRWRETMMSTQGRASAGESSQRIFSSCASGAKDRRSFSIATSPLKCTRMKNFSRKGSLIGVAVHHAAAVLQQPASYGVDQPGPIRAGQGKEIFGQGFSPATSRVRIMRPALVYQRSQSAQTPGPSVISSSTDQAVQSAVCPRRSKTGLPALHPNTA